MRAYFLKAPLLRAAIDVDTMRTILPFVEPFPEEYVALLLDPDYAPDLDRLIDDYITFNPTRNRELDMLTVFTHLDEERVRAQLDDPLIGGRPTFTGGCRTQISRTPTGRSAASGTAGSRSSGCP